MRVWSCATTGRKLRTLQSEGLEKGKCMSSLRKIVTGGIVLGATLFWTVGVFAEGKYPADYKPSKPAATGETNVLVRVFAISTYMTDKINAAGGKESPVCYRNCMTTALNDALKCTESMSSYASSETCEVTGAQKMSTCDPKCQ
jgi:hypothetical protein